MSRNDTLLNEGVFHSLLCYRPYLYKICILFAFCCLCQYNFLSEGGSNNIRRGRTGSFAPVSPYIASVGSGETQITTMIITKKNFLQ